jgi:hypothetical protein
MTVDLKPEPEPGPQGRELGKIDVTEFRASLAKVGKTEGKLGVSGADFRQQPGGRAGRVEDFDDWLVVEFLASGRQAAVGEEFREQEGRDHRPASFSMRARTTRRPESGRAVRLTLKPCPS